MAILSDRTLRAVIAEPSAFSLDCPLVDRQGVTKNYILIDPYPEPQAFQSCSLDIRLGTTYYRKIGGVNCSFSAELNSPIIVYPQEFILLSSLEKFSIPDWVRGNLESKSSINRLGLVNYRGHLDPGFTGDVTLEFQNVTDQPTVILTGDYIAQILFEELDNAAERPYGDYDLQSHYQGQKGATLSWLEKKRK